MNKLILAAVLLPLSTSAFAQSTGGPAEIKQPGEPRVTTPGATTGSVVKPGGLDNGGPGSIGTEIRGATGAESRSNNSGAEGNANKPEVAVPNTGGGGGR